MTPDHKALCDRLLARAKQDREIQRNNEAVAAGLRGQRILFDDRTGLQNTYAVRMQVDHEQSAKRDAALAKDGEAAAEAIATLSAREAALINTIARLTAERDAVQAVTVERCAAVARLHAETGRKKLGAATDHENANGWSIVVSRSDMIGDEIRAIVTIPPQVAAARVLLDAHPAIDKAWDKMTKAEQLVWHLDKNRLRAIAQDKTP